MRSLHWTVQVQTTQQHIATQISLKAQFPTPILVELAGTLPPTSQGEARDSTIVTIFKRAGKMGANPCKAAGSRQGKSLHIWKNKLMISNGTNGKQMLWLVISQSDLKKTRLLSDSDASVCYSQSFITESRARNLMSATSGIMLPSRETEDQSLSLIFFSRFSPIMGLAFNITLYLCCTITWWHRPPISSTVHAGTDSTQTTSWSLTNKPKLSRQTSRNSDNKGTRTIFNWTDNNPTVLNSQIAAQFLRAEK